MSASERSLDARAPPLYAPDLLLGGVVKPGDRPSATAAVGVGVRRPPRGSTASLTVGSLVVFISYLASLYGPINKTCSRSTGWRRARGWACSASSTRWDVERDVADGKPEASRPRGARGEVVWEGGGTSQYASGGPDPGAASISSHVTPGQARGWWVGPTGAGQVDAPEPACRAFYDPTRGRVLVDGVDARASTGSSRCAAQVAMVLQPAAAVSR